MTDVRSARKADVLIAGAGIAGLVAALALLQRGIDVDVFEQADDLKEIGAGLQLGPNGTRVLIDLGLADRLSGLVCEATLKEVRLWNTGQTWKLFDLGSDSIERFGAPYWMVHRADFHRVLLDAVRAAKADAVHLGHTATGFHQDARSVTMSLDGACTEATGRALIAADGVHSRLRRAAGIVDETFFTGIMAWRGLAPADRLPDEMRRNVGTNWVGSGGHVITYPLRDGELFNFVGIVEGRDWPIESWTERGTTAECLADFAGWHPHVLRMIESLDVPFKWGLVGREPLTTWANGRFCMIGDACHPTLPFLAQGANMAIEDGLILARCIAASTDDIAAGLQRFQALRVERTAKIVRGSRRMATHFHNAALADPALAADYVTREWDPAVVKTRYDWLYEYDARTLPLHDTTTVQATV